MTIAKATTDKDHCKSRGYPSKEHDLAKRTLRRLINTGYPANEETVKKAIELTEKLQRTFSLK